MYVEKAFNYAGLEFSRKLIWTVEGLELDMEPVIPRTAVKRNAAFSGVAYYVSSVALAVADYFAVVCAALIAGVLRDEMLSLFYDSVSLLQMNYLYIYGVVPCVFLFFIAYADLYTRRVPFWRCMGMLFKICLYVNVLLMIFTYFLGRAEHVSRLFMLLFWSFSFVNLCSFRYFSKKLLIAAGVWQIPVIVVGAGKTAEILAKTFENEPGIGYRIQGLIEDESRPLTKRYPAMGLFCDAEKIIARSGIKDVIIAVPGLERAALVNLVCRVQPYVRNLTVVPDLFGMPMSNISIDTIYSEKTLLLNLKNNLARKRNRILKRVFDFTASVLGAVVISPILLCIACCIYISSPGPIIFSHMRIGAHGKKFPCYKFRSMVKDAEKKLEQYLKNNPSAKEEWEKEFKLKDDPRITKIGAFLRKTSLDELPQLMNVVKGEMSLVGPRPIVDKEIEKYGDQIHDYYLVHPGMTGYWQISGRNDVDYDKRVRMDSWYVRNWSLWQDIVILIKTVKVVLARQGAY